MPSQDICFHSPHIFAGDVGVIDRDACVVHGVSLITGNLVAEGHGLTVDKQTLTELQACAKSRGKVPVGLDHSAGIASTCGYITGFRVDGDKLRGDLHLLKTHEETPRILERAETMPNCFGLSVAFKGPPKGVPIPGGGMAARCEKLLSIDLVQRPAANDGLFSVPVDNKDKNNMAKDATGKEIAEPTLAEVLEAVQNLTGRIDKQDEFLQSLAPENTEPTLEDFANASDEDLETFNKANNTNITRADIDAAVAEAVAGEGQGEGGDQGGGQPTGEPAQTATAGAGVDVSTGGSSTPSAELSALKKQVLELQAHNQKVELKAKTEAEEIELAAIEQKALTLASQRDQAIKLAEGYKAEVEALRMAVRTGTRPVKAGIDNGVRMFGANGDGELHEFQLRVKQLTDSGKTEAEAIRFAIKENPAAHADWVQSQRKMVA